MRVLPTLSAACGLALLAACQQPAAPEEGVREQGGMTMPDGVGVMQKSPVGATANVTMANAQGAPAGTATLRQGPTGLVIRVEATGLTPGWHGIHFHAVGTCEGPAFDSAGSHVHGGGESAVHGLLNADRNDSGDLPNVYADADGRVFAEIFSPFVRLANEGEGEPLLDADGSALLIHAQPDDHTSQPIGGAGDRVACGVIRAG